MTGWSLAMADGVMDKVMARLASAEKVAEEGGGTEKTTARNAVGKLTARQRLTALLDHGSFKEMDKLVTHECHDFGMQAKRIPGDGVVTGHGMIDGRIVFVYAQDFTVLGGSLSATNAAKITKVQDLSLKVGAPIVGLNDSGGARIQEGVSSLGGYADIFLRNTLASGVVPQINMILGPCAGGAVYSPGITDFVVMPKTGAQMYITGPDVIKAVNGEEVNKEDLGGVNMHAVKSGVVHLVGEDEMHSIALVRELMSYLPANNTEEPPVVDCNDPTDRVSLELRQVIPIDSAAPYDVRDVIAKTVDNARLFEIQRDYAENIVCAFARVGGRPVGVVANQPMVLAGCLDIGASLKAARFVRFCDAFNIPVVTFVDTPGFLPGIDQESGGIIKHGAKLIYAYAEATVPKITVILRKAYGGAYIVMSSKHMRGDVNLAYPTAEVAVMGPEGAVNILNRRELDRADDRVATANKYADEYREKFANPFTVAEKGFVDAVIDPANTRIEIASALRMLANKRDSNPWKKHGNIPL